MRKCICILTVFALIFCGFMGVKNAPVKQRVMSVNAEKSSEIPGAEKPASPQKNLFQTGSSLRLDCRAAVLMDASTGKILYAMHENKKLPPASVTKVMTMLLAMEALESGQIKLQDRVTVSENASAMGGSQMYMEPGEVHTVEELMKGITMVSANDGCVAMAEFLAGSTDIFVEKMNSRASQLGMKNTHFANTNGLPAMEHYTSALDIALMSRQLVEHEKIRDWSTRWQDTIKVGLPGKEKEFGLTNTNKLVKTYRGAFGLKTGFTQEAGYCLSAAAERNQMTLIAVVMGAKTSKERNSQIATLLDYGFAHYNTVRLVGKSAKVSEVRLKKAEPERVNIICKEEITALKTSGEKSRLTTKTEIKKNWKLPLKKGSRVGKIILYRDGKKEQEYPLITAENINKARLWTLIKRTLGER